MNLVNELSVGVIDAISWILGLIIITLFSWNYFNQEIVFARHGDRKNDQKQVFTDPVLPRFATSPGRFWKWYFWFWSFTVGIFVLLARYLKISLAADGPPPPSEWYMMYPPVFAAFVIAGLVTLVPSQLNVINFLKKMRDIMHARAKIPEEALNIFENIIDKKKYLVIENSQDSKLQKKIIEHVGPEYLSEKDFAISWDFHERNTIEKDWIKICFLKTQIDNLTSNENGKYSYNVKTPELVYREANNNFDIIKEEIKAYKHYRDTYSNPSLKERTRLLLKQFSKILVCLVFSSEPTEKMIYEKLQQLGVNCRKKPKYEIDISFLLTGLVIFSFVTLIIAFVLGVSLGKESIDAAKAIKIGIAAVLVICAPIMCVFGLKMGFVEIWHVRGQYSNRQSAPTVYVFLVGLALGVLGIYLTSYTGLFVERKWTTYLPYGLLAGLSSSFTAFVIDMKPRVWRSTSAFLRALFIGVAGMAAFFIVGLIATICVENLRASNLSAEFLNTQKYTLTLITIIGFVSGGIISLFSEYATKIEDESEELRLNISEYLLPVFECDNIGLSNISDLNRVFQEKIKTKSLSKEFRSYLLNMGCVSSEGDLAEKCIHLLADLKKENFSVQYN